MASIPFSFDCYKEGGFVMDPNEHKCVGYITSFSGLNSAQIYAADLTVSVPFQGTPGYKGITLTPAGTKMNIGNVPSTTQVVGVIEKFNWNGGVGDPIQIDFWVSQENATQIKAFQQSTLTTTKINNLGWWVINYDQETKVWFEQAYPAGLATGSPQTYITGLVTQHDNPAIDVDLNFQAVKDGIDVYVYKCHIEVAPAANAAYGLQFANSSNKPIVKSWGLTVGTLAKGALAAT